MDADQWFVLSFLPRSGLTLDTVGPYTDGRTFEESSPAHLVGMQKVGLFVQLLKNGGIKDADLHTERDLQTIRWHKIAVRFLGTLLSSLSLRGLVDQCGDESVGCSLQWSPKRNNGQGS